MELVGFFNGLFSDKTSWGSGLISIYHQKGSSGTITGERGEAYGGNGLEGQALDTFWKYTPVGLVATIFNWDYATSSIEINRDSKPPTIEVESPGLFDDTTLSYSLEGWVGRYSMPLEFLLATHIATMAPDLSYKMATEFDTDVEILLYESDGGNIDAAVQEEGNEATKTRREELSKANSSIWTNVWDFADNISFNSKEALKVLQETNLKSYTGDNAKYKCKGPIKWTELARTQDAIMYTTEDVDPNEINEAVKSIFEKNGNNYQLSGENVVVSGEAIESAINNIKNEFLEMNSSDTSGENNSSSSTNNNSNTNSVRTETIQFSYNLMKPAQMTTNTGKTIDFGESEETAVNTWMQYSDEWEKEAFKLVCKICNFQEKDIQSGKEKLENMLQKVKQNYLNGQNMEVPNETITVNIKETASRYRSIASRSNSMTYKYKYPGESVEDTFKISGTLNDEDWIFRFKVQVSNEGSNRYMWNIIFEKKPNKDQREDMLCSDDDNDAEEACKKCTKYVKLIYEAMNQIKSNDFKTYVPYINKVTDHWFRNVYFTKAAIESENDIIISNDDEYEKKTGERWTEYEMYTDDSGKEQYELYIYKKENGEYKTELEDIVCRDVGDGKGDYKLSDDGVTYVKVSNGNYNLFTKNSSGKVTEYNNDIEEFRVGKKAKTKENKDIFDGKSSAYGKKPKDSEGSWETLEINGDSPEKLQDAKALGLEFLYKMDYKLVEQVEDGERGETNPTIKKLFLDEYYIFDGTKPTAALIREAKNMADSDDPDDFKNKFNNWKKKKIKTTFDGEDYEATIDQISGPISLTHNSLTAFSILENMHTLDAEYIYHDFKELIVELNYFDKEDLVEAEEEVMMFPVAGVSGAGWPVVRYDKREDFYGTLIHSAEDLEARRAETEAELVKNGIVDQGDDKIEDPDNSNVSKSDNTVKQDSFLQIAEECHKEQKNKTYAQSGQNIPDTTKKGGSSVIDCSSYVTYVLYMAGFEDLKGYQQTSRSLPVWCEKQEWQKITNASDLTPGDVCFYAEAGRENHHVNIFVEKEESDYKFWDCGCTNWIQSDVPTTHGMSEFVYAYRPAGITASSTPSKDEENVEFAGFAGSTKDAPEYVVAPVTGEVVKYGTVNRKNLENGKDNEVGFIKIRVLGAPECKAGSKKGCTRFGGAHQSVSAGDGKKYSKGKLNATDWLDDNYSEEKLKKLGYDYFWSEYNSAGIGDHYVYLEGFDVSDILGKGEHSEGKTGKNIKKLAKYIEEHEEANSYSTQYTVPNLLDDTREFELQVEEEAKKKAAYTITATVKEEGKDVEKIYIKEGAVIGQTFSSDNKEITEEEDVDVLKKKQNEDNDEVETKIKKYNIGNYLRINFRDTDDEVVENVEDFVETGMGGNGTIFAGDQEYQAQEGDLELLADAIHHEHCGAGHGSSKEEHLYQSESMGFTILNKLSSDGKYWIDYSDSKYIWAPDKSKLYNLVCRQDEYKFYAIATEANCGDTLNLKERADQGKLNSCEICLEAAEFCLKNDSLNLANNGKFDTGYNNGDPMPHTCWEQGANWSGGRKWLYDGDYLFDTFDK